MIEREKQSAAQAAQESLQASAIGLGGAKIFDDVITIDCGAISSRCEEGIDGTDELPWDSLCRIGAICLEGREKHGKGNWRQGVGSPAFIERRLKHAVRHLMKYLNGDRSEDHLAKAGWGIIFMMELQRLTEQQKIDKLRQYNEQLQKMQAAASELR